MTKLIGKIIEWIFIGIACICLPFAMIFGVVSGLINKALGRKYQDFTRNVEGLGELTARGIKEKDCKEWIRRIKIPHWNEAEIRVSSKLLKNESLLAVKVDEYQKAMKNIESIVVAIRNNDVYKNALKDGQDTLIAEEEIYIELNDEDSKGMDPYISISYPSGNYYVWFSIQNGEMTYFDVSKNQDD